MYACPRKIFSLGIFLCTYLQTYIHTYMHTYIHTYIYTQIYTYIQTYMHACIVRYACIHAFASGDGLRCLQTSRFFVLVPAGSHSIVHAGHTVEVESFVALGFQGIGFTWGFRGSGFLLAHSHGLRGLEYTMYMYIYIQMYTYSLSYSHIVTGLSTSGDLSRSLAAAQRQFDRSCKIRRRPNHSAWGIDMNRPDIMKDS